MAPTVAEIQDSFETKPSQCMVSSHPTRAEVRKLRKSIKANLKRLPCVIPGTEETGWAWILMSETQWDAHQQAIIARDKENNPPEETTEDTNEEANSATDTQPKEPQKHPKVENPMKFDSKTKRSDKVCSALWAECQQDLELFQCKSNLIQASLQDLEEAIPSELIADLCDEDDELCLSATPSTLLHHMEDLCVMLSNLVKSEKS